MNFFEMCTSSLTIYRSLFSCYLRENRNHQGLVTDPRTPLCFPEVAKSVFWQDSSFPTPPVILDDINHQVQVRNRWFLARKLKSSLERLFPATAHQLGTGREQGQKNLQVIAMGWPGLGLSDPCHTHNVHIPAGVGGLDRIIAHIIYCC